MKRIRLTESDIHRIVKESVNKVLKESLNSLTLHMYTPGVGNTTMNINSVEDVYPYIDTAEYWDVTNGPNSSEPSNLVAWGGEGGYWANLLNDPSTKPSLRKFIETKRQ